MKIIVLVKQVPDTNEIKIDKVNGTLIRTGVPSIINPDDLAAVEEALKLKERYNATITIITMGPNQAKDMLRELLARGIDEAILISDPKFAGADTWATSNTLSEAIKKIDYDLIIAGRQAIDGDTAQVGPQVAEKLNIPQITYVHEIIEITNNYMIVKKHFENRIELLRVKLPCLITTLAEMNEPRLMNCVDIITSFNKEIKILNNLDLNIDSNLIGLKGSPTQVKRTFNKTISTDSTKYEIDKQEAVNILIKTLIEKQLLGH